MPHAPDVTQKRAARPWTCVTTGCCRREVFQLGGRAACPPQFPSSFTFCLFQLLFPTNILHSPLHRQLRCGRPALHLLLWGLCCPSMGSLCPTSLSGMLQPHLGSFEQLWWVPAPWQVITHPSRSSSIVCSNDTRGIAPPRGKSPRSGVTSAQRSVFTLFSQEDGASLLASAAAPSTQTKAAAARTDRQLISGTWPTLFIGTLGRTGKGQSLPPAHCARVPPRLRRAPNEEKRLIRGHWGYQMPAGFVAFFLHFTILVTAPAQLLNLLLNPRKYPPAAIPSSSASSPAFHTPQPYVFLLPLVLFPGSFVTLPLF